MPFTSYNQSKVVCKPCWCSFYDNKETKHLLVKKEKEKSPLKKEKYITQFSELSCNISPYMKYATPYRRAAYSVHNSPVKITTSQVYQVHIFCQH